jgi:hypothetical protein
MGTPNKLLKILVPNAGELTIEKWIEILEHRKATLEKYFDRFTLSGLSNTPLVAHSKKSIGDCINLHTPQDVNLHFERFDVQGVYSFFHESYSNTWKIWGLTRKGVWVVVTIRTMLFRNDLTSIIGFECYECSLTDLLKNTQLKPWVIFQRLNQEIVKWQQKSQNNLDVANKLIELVSVEDALVEHLYLGAILAK